MRIYISYFYKIRFMNPKLLPISTAKYDPGWFRQPDGSWKLDSNNVANGLRCNAFVFDQRIWDKLAERHEECSKDCPRLGNCKFMHLYKRQLDSAIDFNYLIRWFENVIENYKIDMMKLKSLYLDNVDIVLLVHEPETCKCAERPVIVQYFKEHGIDVQEWEPL